MNNALDDKVSKLGGWDQLSVDEKLVYEEHLKVIEGKSVTIEDTKAFMRRMITDIERILVNTAEGQESVGLKARLKNALMLEAFLFSPEKAKEALERFYRK